MTPTQPIVAKFGICLLCGYREGDLLTEPQKGCTHDWVQLVRRADGTREVEA